jgi:hypothetical protein
MEEDETAKQPGLRVVAENSSAALAEKAPNDRLTWALRDLAANLLRIIRGAGRPPTLVANMDAVIRGIEDYRETTGHWPWPEEYSAALSIDRDDEWRRGLKGFERDSFYAEERIIRGALQQAASRLVGQKTQERMGESEMYDGIHDLEKAREEMRKEREAAYKAARAPKRGRPRRG